MVHVSWSFIPLPLFSKNYMQYIMHYLKEIQILLFNCSPLWLHSVHAVIYILSPIVPLPPSQGSFSALWFVWFVSFLKHFWYVHGAKHTYHGLNPQNICTAKKKLLPNVVSRKTGDGGGVFTSLCTYGRILAIRQGKFKVEIDFFKDWVVVQADIQMQ